MAADTTHALDIEDWAELFGFGSTLQNLGEGLAYPADFRERIVEAREEYPGVPLDYFKPLAAMEEYVGEIEAAVSEQNNTLDALNLELSDVGLDFTWERDRLLTDSERTNISQYLDWITDLIEEERATNDERNQEVADLGAELQEIGEQIIQVNDQIQAILEEIRALGAEDDE